uniref:Uncharacterized protein n=1 Tax=Cucumis melo TaxID=3656 RepID=A0A9I9EB59_CUCME
MVLEKELEQMKKSSVEIQLCCDVLMMTTFSGIPDVKKRRKRGFLDVGRCAGIVCVGKEVFPMQAMSTRSSASGVAFSMPYQHGVGKASPDAFLLTPFSRRLSPDAFLPIWCHDIGREQDANKPLLKTVFQVMTRLFNPHKTTLMFVIRD